MKRCFLIFLVLLCVQQSVFAVLKEKNLEQTLQILRTELTNDYREQRHRSDISRQRSEQASKELLTTLKKSEQNALMLYSQQSEYVFDLTYACNEATELWWEFRQKSMPFDEIINHYETEIERYERLRQSLNEMPKHMLSQQAQTDRSVCLALATALLNTQRRSLESYQEDIERNAHVRERLEEQHRYAQKRYDAVQQSIFVNGDQSFFHILTILPRYLKMTSMTIVKKYVPKDASVSQWSGKYILFLFAVIIIYGFLAVGLSMAVIHWIMPKLIKKKWWPTSITREDFRKKRPYIVMASTAILFAIILALIRVVASTQNFVIMASDLLVEFAWLMGIVLVSLLVRIEAHQIRNGFKVYLPIMVMGFIVIIFRIILVPNLVVNLLFPPILLGFAIWQWRENRRHTSALNKEDEIYSWMTLMVLLFSVVSSWMGYTLLSVQVLIWWIMQLTCVLTITFFYKVLRTYGEQHYDDSTPIKKNWAYGFLSDALLPVTGVCSVMLSIFWAAGVFDLSNICWKIFVTDFIDMPQFKLSMWKLSLVLSLFFLFRYLSRLAKRLLAEHFNAKATVGMRANRAVMGANAVNILVWGVFIMISMSILKVGNTWLVVISGGLATGLGFASKDILENIYYGISLMAGRIHIGDTIEIDGVRGVVDDMNYTSTMIEAVDGSVIAFQNSQLFTKNYKNLTKNNGWEMVTIPIGVAYGTNINRAKQIIVDVCLAETDRLHDEGKEWIDKTRGITVGFTDFGESSVNLKVIAWMSVAQKFFAQDALRTAIYDALNANEIEIPFPQTDVHIINN